MTQKSIHTTNEDRSVGGNSLVHLSVKLHCKQVFLSESKYHAGPTKKCLKIFFRYFT